MMTMIDRLHEDHHIDLGIVVAHLPEDHTIVQGHQDALDLLQDAHVLLVVN